MSHENTKGTKRNRGRPLRTNDADLSLGFGIWDLGFPAPSGQCVSRSRTRCSSERTLTCVATGVGTRVRTSISTSTSTSTFTSTSTLSSTLTSSCSRSRSGSRTRRRSAGCSSSRTGHRVLSLFSNCFGKCSPLSDPYPWILHFRLPRNLPTRQTLGPISRLRQTGTSSIAFGLQTANQEPAPMRVPV